MRKQKITIVGKIPLMDTKISRWKWEEEEDICIISSSFFKMYMNYKRENSNFTVGRQYLSQVIKANITSNKM